MTPRTKSVRLLDVLPAHSDTQVQYRLVLKRAASGVTINQLRAELKTVDHKSPEWYRLQRELKQERQRARLAQTIVQVAAAPRMEIKL